MRVVDSLRYLQVTRHLSGVQSQYAEASKRALSGRRLAAPSTDPVAAAELVQNRSRAAQVAAQRAAIRSVRGDTELAEGALAEAGALMQRAREIAVQGGNDQLGAAARQSLAPEVQQIREQLLAIANTKGTSGYLFAGSQTTTRPFESSGAFLGDDAARAVDAGSGSPVQVNVSGEQAFTAAGGRDLFADLDALATALSTNDGDAVRATLGGLESGHAQLARVRGQAGLIMNRLDTSESALDRAELLTAKRDQDVGAADPIAAYSDLVNLSQTLERSIGISRQILSLGALSRS